MPSLNLSENDRAVLNSIFNPSQPLGENAFEEDIPELLEGKEYNQYLIHIIANKTLVQYIYNILVKI